MQLLSRKPRKALGRYVAYALSVLALAACGGRADTAVGVDAGEQASRCVAPAGTNAAPHNVQDVLDLLNALPKPVTLPCFLETLQRPLRVNATRSTISAQPAVGRRSPRIFLFFDGLDLSVVPAGMGSPLLEFGEARPGLRTLKAEMEFPVTSALARDAPFTRILYQDKQTSCSFCHAAEMLDDRTDFTQAFVSLALRPAQQTDRVSVAELAAELPICDSAQEPYRCAMLQSLYGQGMPIDSDFPDTYAILR